MSSKGGAGGNVIANLTAEERRVLAISQKLTEREMLILADDEEDAVLRELAMNPCITTRVQIVLAQKEYTKPPSFFLIFNKRLKLVPAIMLYYKGDVGFVNALKLQHPALCKRIIRLEREALKNKNISFLKLGSDSQRNEVVKQAVIGMAKNSSRLRRLL